MRIIWITVLLVLAGLCLAAAALPTTLQRGGGISGGGSVAAAGTLRLNGNIGLWSTGVSQGGLLRLEGGPASALNPAPIPNAADPAWLRHDERKP